MVPLYCFRSCDVQALRDRAAFSIVDLVPERQTWVIME
jgi:hypothetical protein